MLGNYDLEEPDCQIVQGVSSGYVLRICFFFFLNDILSVMLER